MLATSASASAPAASALAGAEGRVGLFHGVPVARSAKRAKRPNLGVVNPLTRAQCALWPFRWQGRWVPGSWSYATRT